MSDLMIKLSDVTKVYRLGQIGSTTLREEFQRLGAKIKRKEDPTKKVNAKDLKSGEVFHAVDGIDLEVNKGERIGIIGHNGAGKSTLLKLISRITAPSEGFIGLNGRIASMLEVGTGFHPELTGRENIYVNGAILGMTKKEIDSKVESIIEFSECRQFIDTPVKRYSSGMYVKLAFSVAAHLDSEIMIMDEVLAVGDMAFQKKCLDKMNEVSRQDGKTILYVSHNMNTIRALCSRCIVLDHGKIIFDGDVENAIDIYMKVGGRDTANPNHTTIVDSDHLIIPEFYSIESIDIDRETNVFESGDCIPINLKIKKNKDTVGQVYLRCVVETSQYPVGMTMLNEPINFDGDYKCFNVSMPTAGLSDSHYLLSLVLFETGQLYVTKIIDRIPGIYNFTIKSNERNNLGLKWNSSEWGYCSLGDMKLHQ